MRSEAPGKRLLEEKKERTKKYGARERDSRRCRCRVIDSSFAIFIFYVVVFNFVALSRKKPLRPFVSVIPKVLEKGMGLSFLRISDVGGIHYEVLFNELP